jgi:hypothetical protein
VAKRTPSFAYSLEARAPHGLDPKKYQVLLVVHRRDDELITDQDVETIEATLGPHALPPGSAARGVDGREVNQPAPLVLHESVSAEIDAFADAFALSRADVVALALRCLDADFRADPEVIRARIAAFPKGRRKIHVLLGPLRKPAKS